MWSQNSTYVVRKSYSDIFKLQALLGLIAFDVAGSGWKSFVFTYPLSFGKAHVSSDRNDLQRPSPAVTFGHCGRPWRCLATTRRGRKAMALWSLESCEGSRSRASFIYIYV